MKMRLSLQLSHTAETEDIQPQTFERAAALALDLPLGRDEFMSAFDNLATDSLPKMAGRLCDAVARDASEYIKRETESGTKQLTFPFLREIAAVSRQPAA